MATKTNSEIRAEMFSQITEIIEKSNCSTFKIIGYKYLGTRLILSFDDCKQVFDWRYQESKFHTKFFTNDFTDGEKISHIQEFNKEFELDMPEVAS